MANKRIPIAVQDQAGSLYLSESKIYPREVSGRFQRLLGLGIQGHQQTLPAGLGLGRCGNQLLGQLQRLGVTLKLVQRVGL
ncbi:MAG: hypothetical protein CVV17_06660, partial [Gammaproteobacteria bacterium HGW-Gammaproteobacteria-7]